MPIIVVTKIILPDDSPHADDCAYNMEQTASNEAYEWGGKSTVEVIKE